MCASRADEWQQPVAQCTDLGEPICHAGGRPHRFQPHCVDADNVLMISLSCRLQDIAEQLEHPGHRRRMALVCHAWRDAEPISSYNVILRPEQSLTELSSRLAVITARHSSLTSLSFRCARVAQDGLKKLLLLQWAPAASQRGEHMALHERAKDGLVAACWAHSSATAPAVGASSCLIGRHIHQWCTIQRLQTHFVSLAQLRRPRSRVPAEPGEPVCVGCGRCGSCAIAATEGVHV